MLTIAMARPPNTTETVNITLSTTPAVKRYLEAIVRDGLYGKNVAEVAERLIAEKIRELRGTTGLSEALNLASQENALMRENPT